MGRGRNGSLMRCRTWRGRMAGHLFLFLLVWAGGLSHPHRPRFGLGKARAALCEEERGHDRARDKDVSESLHNFGLSVKNTNSSACARVPSWTAPQASLVQA